MGKEHQEATELPPVNEAAVERYNNDADTSSIAIRSLDDIKRISTIFIGSNMFKGDKNLTQQQQLYQAGVKIIAGVEFGIQPFAAMRGINIINGNAEMSANLMAAKVKKHPKYDYRVTRWDNDGCVITFYEILRPGDPREKWDVLGESSFERADAEQAGLTRNDNWRKFPRNMYFARAMSNGVRLFTPDVFYGAPVYVEGEISGEFDEPAHEPTKQVEADAKPEAVEGEVVVDDTVDDIVIEIDEPVIEEEATEPTPEDHEELLVNVANTITSLELPARSVVRLVKEVTGKLALTKCTYTELEALADELDRITSGERVLESDWFDKKKEAL